MKKQNTREDAAPRRGGRRKSFTNLLSIALLMCILMFVLVAAAKNVTYTSSEPSISLLEVKKSELEHSSESADCLLIYEDEDTGNDGLREMSAVLSEMRVRYDVLECSRAEPDVLENYRYLVLSVTHYQYLGELLGSIKSWVKAGGNLMILYPPEINGSFQSLFDILGIQDCGTSYAFVETIRFSRGFLIGGDSRDFPIVDGYESAMSVILEEDCEVFAQTVEEYPTPLIWRRSAGEGTVVVDNLSYLEKGYRGLHAGVFSLLDDFCVYPVINASAFYIDDFPSPVPSGYSEYIERDYNMSVRDFYTARWWADTYNLAEKYGIKYTGMVIEQYSDQVSDEFKRNPDRERYLYFGNMLLDAGGEIGLHGYNHMPLVLENFDYEGLFDSYNQWPSYGDMYNAVTELFDFCASLYPDRSFQVYVPPSNIISEEGIAMLASDFPEIKTIASIYIPGEVAYAQDYQVEDNGLISTPRVISGYVLDDYMRIVALSELNLHFVNSHFQHPDDVLDVDRGAELGWEKMFENLSDYVDWLYSSAPEIRSMTGSEIAAAVQRYDYIELERVDKPWGIQLDLRNFYDEAWLMLRLNDGQVIAHVTGGEVTQLNDTLYLVRADAERVEIRFRLRGTE